MTLVTCERGRLVDILWHLVELDDRRLCLERGYSSLWAYCIGRFGWSEGTTFRRTTSARLLRRFPVIAGYLAAGKLSLMTLCALRDVLRDLGEASPEGVLDRAAGKTEKDVELLVKTLRPEPAPADLLRRLPARPTSILEVAAAPAVEPAPEAPVRLPPPFWRCPRRASRIGCGP